MARELVYRATGETDCRIFRLSQEQADALWGEISEFSTAIQENRFTPTVLKKEGRPMEFSCFPIKQYEGAVSQETYPSFSELMDAFYETRERMDRVRQRGAELIRTATTARDRLRRKLAMQEKDYAATQNRDELRICGDLITSNLYRMERGQTKLTCENFYDENCAQITIPLAPLLTPQQNAAKYYKRYNKAKTAEKHLREQMEIARRDLEYLESVLEEIDKAELEQDFNDIRGELREGGFIRQQGKKGMERPAKPRQFKTSAGYRVLVGRNNRQNDKLTLKDADHRDLWFHTQKIHGSHVILCTEGKTVDEDTIVEAAKIAAYYSQARESGNVPVDYTPVKNVKKPAGGRPGMVIYHVYNTVNVTPDPDFVKARMVK